jgi:hypothetical protein
MYERNLTFDTSMQDISQESSQESTTAREYEHVSVMVTNNHPLLLEECRVLSRRDMIGQRMEEVDELLLTFRIPDLKVNVRRWRHLIGCSLIPAIKMRKDQTIQQDNNCVLKQLRLYYRGLYLANCLHLLLGCHVLDSSYTE